MSKPDRQSKPISSRIIKIPGPLHYRNLQFAKNQALRNTQSYKGVVHLNYQAIKEIHWWRDHLIAWNGRAILRQPIQLTIKTDASTKGAHCQGVRTGGGGLPKRKLHINCLDLLAVSLAVKTFARGVGLIHILILMDSVSAVTLYINMQVRGNPLFCTEQPSSRVVDMVFNQPCQANCPAYPRYNQCSGRSGFTSFSGLQRLETKSTNLCSPQQYLGPLRDRPVCQPIDQATSQICEIL